MKDYSSSIAEEIPGASVNVYSRPGDIPLSIAERWRLAAELAESILDPNITVRASLYAQFPDQVLSDYQNKSQKLRGDRLQNLKLGLLSIATGGVAGILSYASEFNSVSIATGGAAIAGTAIVAIQSWRGERARSSLEQTIDQDLRDRDIRLTAAPDTRLSQAITAMRSENLTPLQEPIHP